MLNLKKFPAFVQVGLVIRSVMWEGRRCLEITREGKCGVWWPNPATGDWEYQGEVILGEGLVSIGEVVRAAPAPVVMPPLDAPDSLERFWEFGEERDLETRVERSWAAAAE